MKQRELYTWTGRTHMYQCKLSVRARDKEGAIETLCKEMNPNDYGWGILEVDSNPICVCYIEGSKEE